MQKLCPFYKFSRDFANKVEIHICKFSHFLLVFSHFLYVLLSCSFAGEDFTGEEEEEFAGEGEEVAGEEFTGASEGRKEKP